MNVEEEFPPDGSVIRFMGSDSVDIPLWSGGLIAAEVAELVDWGVSEQLARDVDRWGQEWQRRQGADAPLEGEAIRLIERLEVAFASRDYCFQYVRDAPGAPFVTLSRAAAELGISPSNVQRLVDSGRLLALEVSGAQAISVPDLRALKRRAEAVPSELTIENGSF